MQSFTNMEVDGTIYTKKNILAIFFTFYIVFHEITEIILEIVIRDDRGKYERSLSRFHIRWE